MSLDTFRSRLSGYLDLGDGDQKKSKPQDYEKPL